MKKSGFTLVEMSMVLVIISFLIGAMFVGQSLIRSSHLNATLSDVIKYSSAFNDFADKYKALPGDFANAQASWGAPSGGCPEGTGAGYEVCNGNGDGNICNASNAANVAELHSEWIELANAQLIPGSYHYLPATGGGYAIGTNVPMTPIGNATFQFFFATCPLGDMLYSTVSPYAVHWLALGALTPTGTGVYRPVLSGEDAQSMDVKADDGRPGYGKIRASRNGTAGGYTPNCQTTNSPDTAAYNQSTTDMTCTLLFQLSQ